MLGLVLGAVASIVAWSFPAVVRWAIPSMCVAFGVALVLIGEEGAGPLVVALAGTGAAAAGDERSCRAVGLAGVAAFGFAGAMVVDDASIAAVVVAAAVVASLAAPSVAASYGAVGSWVLLAVAAVGTYGAVPDTEVVIAVAGLVVAVGPLVVIAGRRSIDSLPTVVAVLSGLVLWGAAVGSVGRPASVVGGSLGVAALGVAASLMRRRRSWPIVAASGAVVTAAALFASRVLGDESAWERALLGGAATLVVVAALTWGLVAVSGRVRH